ncbi:prevent-host-death protein [Halomonas urumqiensis]|uniref:prevent-host-death protein n=1 Tax=Halomonas urumqiensis TaxID=1684789 RepID=UPI001E51BC0E|nr:prevent-host-death protein [Halomonas urumqiensis]
MNRFRDNLKALLHQSADDWEREQETLYVLQNCSLMRQLAESAATHNQGNGYIPKEEEIHEITRL